MHRLNWVSRIRSTPLRRAGIMITFPLMFIFNVIGALIMVPLALIWMNNTELFKSARLRWNTPKPKDEP